jgi:hypothetical protein
LVVTEGKQLKWNKINDRWIGDVLMNECE